MELIESNVLRAGDSLPSERELSEMYSVNRMTVRQAITGLCNQNTLRRVHGVGTFVTEKKTGEPFFPAVMGFSERFRSAGRKPTSRVITMEVVPASPFVAERLRLETKTPVISLIRLRLIDDEPLMLEKSFLPYETFPDLLEDDFNVQSLYAALAERYNIHIYETEQTLEPTLLTKEEGNLFNLKSGLAAMLVSVTAYAFNRLPVEFSKSVIRGDQCRYYFTVNTHSPIISR